MDSLIQPLELTTVVVRDPTLVSAQLNDEVVMMDARSGTYYGLSETTGTIWQLLEQPTTIEAVVTRLMETYDVERSVCEHEVLTILEDMRSKGLITRAG